MQHRGKQHAGAPVRRQSPRLPTPQSAPPTCTGRLALLAAPFAFAAVTSVEAAPARPDCVASARGCPVAARDAPASPAAPPARKKTLADLLRERDGPSSTRRPAGPAFQRDGAEVLADRMGAV